MAVHQLVPHFRLGDETAQAAVQLRALLRRLGHWGGLYAGGQEPGAEALVQPLRRSGCSPEDWVLLHHAHRQPAARPGCFTLPCRRGVVFHDFPPCALNRGTPLGARRLAARARLSGMAAHVSLGIGVSRFYSRGASRAGYGKVHTVPLFVEAARFARTGRTPRSVPASPRRRSRW